MDKKTQRHLGKWLKQQGKLAKNWLWLSIALGLASTFMIVLQAAMLASILHQLIIEGMDKSGLIPQFIILATSVALRGLFSYGREVAGFKSGEAVRVYIRQLIIDRARALGPAYLNGKPAGSWATLLLEQVEDMHDFFAKYLPQMTLSVVVPVVILVVVFPQNWAAGVIFLITAPLIPIFMALVGKKAAGANTKNFKALQRLSGHFYDRLQSLTTIRLFDQTKNQIGQLHASSEVFRHRTMDVLKIAFLSSAVLEFFTSISIAITAVYFGFSFIGELNFGHYGVPVTLFTGLFILILAPEFYQPLRDLGTFYHAKQQAIGAAESIVEFLNADVEEQQTGTHAFNASQSFHLELTDVVVFSHNKKALLGPISLTITDNAKVAVVGPSGAGKSTLINVLLGFLPYQGSIKINGIELSSLDLQSLRSQISWVGQNPLLFNGTILENLTLNNQKIYDPQTIKLALKEARASQLVDKKGLDYQITDRQGGLSVGQAQRIALTRALLQNGLLWVLDEPTASLDMESEQAVMQSLERATQNKTTIMVSHQISHLKEMDNIVVIEAGLITQTGSFNELSKQDGLFSNMLKEKLDGLEVSHA